MKPNYALLACILLFEFAAVSCVDSIDTDPTNLIGRWQMVKVIHQGKTISKPPIPDYYNEVEIEFLEDGKLEGTYPLDVFFGNYTIPAKDSIIMECWQYSKVGITDWGNYLDDHSRLIKTFLLKNKGLNLKYKQLALNYGSGELVFERLK